MHDLTAFVGNPQAFPVLNQWHFFNHAGVAPIPRAAADAMRRFAAEAESGAYLGTRWYKDVEALRVSAAGLINAHRDEVAFVKNTSEGIAIVANGIDWKPGDRIVTTGIEYPANIYPWMDVAKRFGVELVLVPEEQDDDGSRAVSLEKILKAADHPKTRLLALSHVEYASGQRHNISALGAFCRERGVLFCVDAIQALGALPVDVRTMNIDYLSADGHKWLLGPEGAGIFFIRRELIERTRPAVVGWMNVINAADYGNYDFTLKPDAGRYEPGSYNIAGLMGLKASLELLQSVGVEVVAERLKTLTDRLIAGVRQKGYQIVSPRTDGQWSGIVSFVSPKHPHEPICTDLRKNHATEIAMREKRLRVSPHFYNTEQQMDRLVELLPE